MVVNWNNTSYSGKQLYEYFNYNINKIDNNTQNMHGQLIMKFWVYEGPCHRNHPSSGFKNAQQILIEHLEKNNAQVIITNSTNNLQTEFKQTVKSDHRDRQNETQPTEISGLTGKKKGIPTSWNKISAQFDRL